MCAITGLILAAGASSRMGTDKALLRIDGETFLARIARQLSAVCARTIVVIGCHAPSIVAAHTRLAVDWAPNADWTRGQFGSLRTGAAAALADDAMRAAVVAPVDHPWFDPSTVQTLVADFLESGADLVKPEHQGQRGHPVLVSRAVLAAALAARDDSNARDLLMQFAARTRIVPVDDPGILMNIDDPEQYERLRRG